MLILLELSGGKQTDVLVHRKKTLVVTTKGEKIIRFRGSALRYCYQYIQNLYYS